LSAAISVQVERQPTTQGERERERQRVRESGRNFV